MSEYSLLCQQLLAIVIMLGGIAMIVGGPTLMGRYYRWIFASFVFGPLNWLRLKTLLLLQGIVRYVAKEFFNILSSLLNFLLTGVVSFCKGVFTRLRAW